ncbi:hypothetical protein JOM56_005272 [Amanita muscaria]
MLTESQLPFLVGQLTQALLYGIYLATLIQCFRWLIFTDEGWEPREKINFLMVFSTSFIFVMSTINLATSLTYELKYIGRDVSWFQYGFYGTAMMMTENIALQNISQNLAIILIDCVLLHPTRCLKDISLLGRVCKIMARHGGLYYKLNESYYAGLSQDNNGDSFKFALIGLKAAIGLYACNIAITIYTTTAIIYRILSSRRNSGGNQRRLNYAMRILAESGILYTSMIIFSLIGEILSARSDSTWAEWFINDISDPMAFSTGCISFNLLLIRVYQSRVELRNSFADSRDDYYGISGIQFNNPQITASSEGLSSNSNALDEVVDEIQEHRRNRERMHEN